LNQINGKNDWSQVAFKVKIFKLILLLLFFLFFWTLFNYTEIWFYIKINTHGSEFSIKIISVSFALHIRFPFRYYFFSYQFFEIQSRKKRMVQNLIRPIKLSIVFCFLEIISNSVLRVLLQKCQNQIFGFFRNLLVFWKLYILV